MTVASSTPTASAMHDLARKPVSMLVGVGLFAAGTLALGWYADDFGAGGTTVWGQGAGDLAGSYGGLHGLVADLARLWAPAGAMVVTLAVMVLAALAITDRVSGWVVALGAGFGFLWQGEFKG